jgi:hypothetical protein
LAKNTPKKLRVIEALQLVAALGITHTQRIEGSKSK